MTKAKENVAKKEVKKHIEKNAKVDKKTEKKSAPTTPKKTKKVEAKKEAPKKAKRTREEIEQELEDLSVIKYAMITEKAVNMIEAENKLVFVVDRNATKPKIRKAVEELYKVKVKSVNIIRDMKARKKAIVTISKEFKADNVATKLGVI
ncbi:MAG: 50S ribosomal protein L23 [Candidatus Diapherotrites archaeon CG11_big_fil_rev_8_21_14_0_20_37_9]|nr:MAG: 50S ribosomal protein L23 [Candidatus Diapherotrites archaeon CG11_big_fil_rev_8_21_14_0_20_37_9]